MLEFEGLVAIVTGGGSGIGLATAKLLAERGARVATFDLDPSAVPLPLFGVRADVTDQESLDGAVATVLRRFDRLDILINNAGIGAAGTIEQNTPEEWHRVFDVNVVGIARMTRAALPHLRKSPVAAIVNNLFDRRNGRLTEFEPFTVRRKVPSCHSRSQWRPITSASESA